MKSDEEQEREKKKKIPSREKVFGAK